jgi:hypothetical protein
VKGFSHEVRSADTATVLKSFETPGDGDDSKPAGVAPAMYAHIDNGPIWARTLFNRVLGAEEAERLHDRRWAIINIWRPIKTITRNPLGVVDTASVRDDDLVPVYARLPSSWGNPTKDYSDQDGNDGQVYNVKANPAHRWYFASHMQPHETLFITIYDTNKTHDGHKRRVVHSAFPYATPSSSDEPRESIEFRSLVVWEDQAADRE